MLHDVRILIQCLHDSAQPEELHNTTWSNTLQQAEFPTEEHHDVSVQDDVSQRLQTVDIRNKDKCILNQQSKLNI